jgi:hypothetical protein
MAGTWVRIGSRILNSAAIVEMTDEGERQLKDGKQRVVRLKLIDGKYLEFAGSEADAIWDAVTRDLVVWLETHNTPQYPMGFHKP